MELGKHWEPKARFGNQSAARRLPGTNVARRTRLISETNAREYPANNGTRADRSETALPPRTLELSTTEKEPSKRRTEGNLNVPRAAELIRSILLDRRQLRRGAHPRGVRRGPANHPVRFRRPNQKKPTGTTRRSTRADIAVLVREGRPFSVAQPLPRVLWRSAEEESRRLSLYRRASRPASWGNIGIRRRDSEACPKLNLSQRTVSQVAPEECPE